MSSSREGAEPIRTGVDERHEQSLIAEYELHRKEIESSCDHSLRILVGVVTAASATFAVALSTDRARLRIGILCALALLILCAFVILMAKRKAIILNATYIRYYLEPFLRGRRWESRMFWFRKQPWNHPQRYNFRSDTKGLGKLLLIAGYWLEWLAAWWRDAPLSKRKRPPHTLLRHLSQRRRRQRLSSSDNMLSGSDVSVLMVLGTFLSVLLFLEVPWRVLFSGLPRIEFVDGVLRLRHRFNPDVLPLAIAALATLCGVVAMRLISNATMHEWGRCLSRWRRIDFLTTFNEFRRFRDCLDYELEQALADASVASDEQTLADIESLRTARRSAIRSCLLLHVGIVDHTEVVARLLRFKYYNDPDSISFKNLDPQSVTLDDPELCFPNDDFEEFGEDEQDEAESGDEDKSALRYWKRRARKLSRLRGRRLAKAIEGVYLELQSIEQTMKLLEGRHRLPIHEQITHEMILKLRQCLDRMTYRYYFHD